MIKIVKFIGPPSKEDIEAVKDYPNTKMLKQRLTRDLKAVKGASRSLGLPFA